MVRVAGRSTSTSSATQDAAKSARLQPACSRDKRGIRGQSVLVRPRAWKRAGRMDLCAWARRWRAVVPLLAVRRAAVVQRRRTRLGREHPRRFREGGAGFAGRRLAAAGRSLLLHHAPWQEDREGENGMYGTATNSFEGQESREQDQGCKVFFLATCLSLKLRLSILYESYPSFTLVTRSR